MTLPESRPCSGSSPLPASSKKEVRKHGREENFLPQDPGWQGGLRQDGQDRGGRHRGPGGPPAVQEDRRPHLQAESP